MGGEFGSTSTKAPCGKYGKGQPVIKASTNSKITLRWKSILLVDGGTCRIRLGKGELV